MQSGNSIADINGLLYEIAPDTHRHTAFARDIANKMKATGRYDIDKKPILHGDFTYLVYPLPPVPEPKKNRVERNPIVFAVGMAVIAGLISLGVAVLTDRIQNRQDYLKDNKQDSLLHHQAELINNLEKRLIDSIATLRADTTLRNK